MAARPTPRSRDQDVDAPGGPAFWAGTALGLAIVAFGLWGLLRHGAQTVPLNWLRFFAGALVLHDLIWAPLVGLGSLVLVRIIPRTLRPALQGTLLVSITAVLVAIPVLTGRGRNPNNPSILPGDYGPDLLKVLAVVWLAGAVLAIRAVRRGPAAGDGQPRSPEPPPPRHGW